MILLPKRLTFIRHAQAIGNVMTEDERAACEIPNHRYPLTDMGLLQPEYVAEYLAEIWGSAVPDLFCQSTFLRPQTTLEIVLRKIGINRTPITDSRLDEKWDGIFHELSRNEIEQRYPEQVRLRKRSGYYHFRAPGGDNCPDVEMRIRSFFAEPRVQNAKHVCIVGHGRWFIILQKLIHDLSVEEFMVLVKTKDYCPNCSVTEYIAPYALSPLPKMITPWRGKMAGQPTEFA